MLIANEYTSRKIPREVLLKAQAMGDDGITWLSSLDTMISDIEKEWEIIVGEAIPGGTHAFVAKARNPEGNQCIFKLALPDKLGGTFDPQVAALTASNGRGYAKLLRYNLEKRSCLLEALGKKLCDFNYSPSCEIKIICATLQESWVKTQHSGLQNMPGVIKWFRDFIRPLWIELRRPCADRVIEYAYTILAQRETDFYPDDFVLIHGDAHNGNVLEAIDGSFKLVDPDGIFYEKAYDLGVLMREWTDELIKSPVKTAQSRCEYLHELTGVNMKAIWDWGMIQCVSTGLLCKKIGDDMTGDALLSIALAWSMVYKEIVAASI
jgi:streptomycin 6-kinase